MISTDGRARAGTDFRRGAATLAALLAIVAMGACRRPASFDTAATRAAVERAAARLRPTLPGDADAVKRLIAEAEAATATGQSDSAWAPALVAAHRALVALSRLESERAARWAVLEPDAAARVERARRQAEAPGIVRREARLWVERAAVQLDVARRLAAAGDLDRANAAAVRAVDWAGRVEASWLELHARFEQPELLRQWRGWIDETVSATRAGRRNALIVDKLGRRLEVYSAGRRVATFNAELGTGGLRRKLHAGDRATPEGRYRVTRIKVGHETLYYKALLLDYPNREDRRRFAEARARAAIAPGVEIGGLIEIHGHGGRGEDWTEGCIALADDEMDRLFRYVKIGTPVTIVGKVP